MKIISYNVNGIRAAINKGFLDWLKEENPEIIGLQEVKANLDQIDASVFEDLGYHVYWYPAFKKGYSGVAILTKIKPKSVKLGMDYSKYDEEGRLIQVDFEDFSFLNAYFPSGTTGDIRQTFKYEFLDDIYGYTQDLRKEKPNFILSGDYNICHKAIDIHNPKANKNTSGFLPEERAWMDKFTDSGFIDTFRKFNEEPHNYSWWSFRANARAKNLGWRIDYHMATSTLDPRLRNAKILADIKHSDHCPILVEID
ncbi:exodeoxyribonuclease III [Algoriphagus halophytocola]|uniref:Exodeoxyribonuclease III n=1 Tax=Algoriphagus halophytocola TaxID=2991499 RepID=A0ABY6MCZ0_9BACT|nr:MULTISPECIES: exodeoxyribonuclease III [unclassified Algoriphagus]UZD21555.1 exodeoxyribonuclease III [Algoriphagus sp. TR-M5]WBL42767.1 exodeoxyribonuclease III [Algoriphagus sp. TR-M9]